MPNDLSILKGIHPGFVLEKKLAERKLAKGRFALSINEFPQTISAITKGKRSINTPLALKIEEKLGLEEGYFMTLQVFYEIKEEKRKRNLNYHPDLSKFSKVLFWDTTIDKIDWEQHKKWIIQRVFERGSAQERDEITRFYGAAAIHDALKKDNA
jgi:plasmid maintenance system antidote protein VapI